MDKKGKGGSGRPFYELPSHVKPCSQIIQETRLQLKYSSRRGPVEMRVESGGGDHLNSHQRLNGREMMEMEEMMRPSPHPGYNNSINMRPVNTQRPFTPRDGASLWGVSSRKRPPSAITLARLSIPIEDGGEELAGSASLPSSRCYSSSAPLTSTNNSSITLDHQIIGSSSAGGHRHWGGGRGERGGFDPINSLGSLSSQSHSGGSLAGIVESDGDEDMGISFRNGTISADDGDMEKRMRLQMKSLSLQNVRTSGTSFPAWALGKIDDGDCGSGVLASFSPKKARHSDTGLGLAGGGAKIKEGTVPHDAKGSGGAGGDKEESYEQHLHNLQQAIQCLSSLVKEYATSSDKPPKANVIFVLKRIRDILWNEDGISRFFIEDDNNASKLRKKLLELIFKLVESNQNDENILFWSSFVLLHCNIIGNNLTTVFKMVFKSSKSTDYKDIILHTEYLNVLMKSFSQICPKTQTESMIYGYGTLKFLCGDDSAVLNRIIDLNLIPIMALHLKILNCEMELIPEETNQRHHHHRVPEGILNGTFQLTSILRSVVGENRALVAVVGSGLLQQLCTTIPWAGGDIDVLTNIMRILSVVSMDGMSCQVMYNNTTFCPSVVRILNQWVDKDDVIVRLSYCLGNLLSNSDDMRVKLFEETDSFNCILKVMSHYLDKSRSSSPASIDILIKTTRVIANWILNPFVGSEICDDSNLANILYATLQSGKYSQELVLCVMCALNNTSFYINYTQLTDGTMKTAQYLFENLSSQELQVKEETVKVLGNLTRNEDVRLMSAEYIGNILQTLDESQETSVELVCATCGVLINVVIEESVKVEFLKNRGVERVIQSLEGMSDIMVSLITCQVLWNLLISHEHQGFNSKDCISTEQSTHLKKVLLTKLSKLEKDDGGMRRKEECDIDHGAGEVGGGCNCNPAFQIIKEDFILVAKDLLDKL